MDTLEKPQSEYERQLERQRQLDFLEQGGEQEPTAGTGVGTGTGALLFEGKKEDDAAGLTRRAGDAAGMESARRFLYDEDEPEQGNPANIPLAGQVVLPTPRGSSGGRGSGKGSRGSGDGAGSGDFKRDNRSRLSPITAVFMSTVATCRGYGFKRLLILSVGVTVLILAILASVAITTANNNKGETNDRSRVKKITKQIVNAGITDASQLSTSTTAQYHALHWLANVDPAGLSPSDPYILQRYALAVVFYSTSASMDHIDPISGWRHQEGWLTGSGFCSWYGVECQVQLGASDEVSTHYDSNSPVTGLNLTDNRVDGTLPTEFTALTSLMQLDLSKNQIQGTLPKELAQVYSLRDLWLRDNQIEGSLPTDFGLFENLRQLHLGTNQLEGTIPAELENIGDLRALGLENNQLKGQIPDLEALGKIATLYLDHNLLTGPLPSSLIKLTNLKDLRMAGNLMTGTMPSGFIALDRLEFLYLNDNNFQGTIPPLIFSKLTRLTQLDVSRNKFEGEFSTKMGDCRDLTILKMEENAFSGTIPHSFALMVDLTQLDLSSNKIHGNVPTLFINLKDMMNLQLDGNNLTGTIPTELSQLRKLKYLYLNGNKLNGPIPSELGDLSNLQSLRLYNNQLTGEVPSEVCSLVSDELLSFLGADCDKGSIECTCCSNCF